MLWAPAGQAQDTGYSLFVTPKKAADQDSSALLQNLLRQQLSTYGGVKLVPFTGPAPAAPKALTDHIEAGYRALNDAVTNAEAAKAEKPGAAALGHFDKALLELQRLQSSGTYIPRREAARLHKGFAVAHTLNKEGPRAQPFINDSLNLWPQQTPREYGWNQSASNLFSFVKKRRDDNVEVGKIAVTGAAGARVVVDGKTAGKIPVTIERLRPGQHLVHISLDGHAPKSILTTVVKDQTVTVDGALTALADKARVEELLPLIGKQRSAAKADPLLDELAQKVGAQRVVALQVSQKKASWAITGYTGGEGETKTHKVTIKRDAQMVTSLQALLTEATGMKPGGAKAASEATSLGGPPASSLMKTAVKDGKGAAKKIGEDVEDTEFYETWWFWTAVGGGVVLITLAAVLAVVLTEEDDAPKPGTLQIQLNPL